MATLDSYTQRTQLLLNDPAFERFNDGDLATYVNIARGQLAGESECIRLIGTLDVDSAAQQYPFSSINLGGFTTSVMGALNVRQITYAIASGAKILHSRPFPWFNSFVIAQPAPEAGPPSVWSQLGQGASGTIFVNLLDGPYVLSLDVVGYPIDLADNSTIEAIPYQFSDAVPWLAAYYALVPTGNTDAADKMYGEYEKFVARGRRAATPGVLPGNFAQPEDPFIANRLGLQQQRGQQ